MPAVPCPATWGTGFLTGGTWAGGRRRGDPPRVGGVCLCPGLNILLTRRARAGGTGALRAPIRSPRGCRMERPGRHRRACLAFPRSAGRRGGGAGRPDTEPEAMARVCQDAGPLQVCTCSRTFSADRAASGQAQEPAPLPAAGLGVGAHAWPRPKASASVAGAAVVPEPGWVPGKFAELKVAGPGVRRVGLRPPVPRVPPARPRGGSEGGQGPPGAPAAHGDCTTAPDPPLASIVRLILCLKEFSLKSKPSGHYSKFRAPGRLVRPVSFPEGPPAVSA